MKKRIAIILIFGIIILLNSISNEVHALEFVPGGSYTIDIGQTLELTPDAPVITAVAGYWSSSNEKVVKFVSYSDPLNTRTSSSVTVQGIKEGKATITSFTFGRFLGVADRAAFQYTITVKDKKKEEAEKLIKAIQQQKGKNVPGNATTENYIAIAHWITADYWYNECKELSKLALTDKGVAKMKNWYTEINKHIRGGKLLTKNSPVSEITDTDILYTAREALKDFIKANKNPENVNNTANNYTNVGSANQKTIQKLLVKTATSDPRTPTEYIDVLENTDKYKVDSNTVGDISKVTNAGSTILSVITTIGIVTSVIILAVIGIKYIMGSVEQKAEYKETLVPYVIGVVLLLSVTTVVNILYKVGQSF